jgi:plasmid stabilization system protein ParE
VKWSPRALRDLQRLHRYLLARNADAAKRAVKAIRAGVRVLAKQPGVGRPIEDMDPAFREWLIDFGDAGYVVLYRIEGKDVVILAVRHQREAGY